MTALLEDLEARSEAAKVAWRAQWAKYDAAVAAGLRGAPLVQIDRKLARLEREWADVYDRLKAARIDAGL